MDTIISINQRIWIDNLSLNSEYDDWSPCLSADGDILFFTSNRPNDHIPNDIGVYDQEIYYSNRKDRKFLNINSLDELNTSSDDVSGGLSYDGQRLLIFKEENGAVIEGTLTSKDKIVASKVFAKHDENYMPAAIKKQLEKADYWKKRY